MELSEIIERLKLIDQGSSADPWYQVLRERLVLPACRKAVRVKQHQMLAAFSQRVVSPVVIREIQIRFDERVARNLTGDPHPETIDSTRFHNLLAACGLTAQLAAQIPWEIPITPAAVQKFVNEKQPGEADLLAQVATHLESTNCGTSDFGYALLMNWINDWLGESTKAYAVPIASISSRGTGVVSQLILRPFGGAHFRPQTFPDLQAAFSFVGQQFLSALNESVPSNLQMSVAWHVKVPSNHESSALLGRSIRGAAGFAFDALRQDNVIPPGILVIADIRDAKLCGVGSEREKIEAATRYDKDLVAAPNHGELIELIVLSKDSFDDVATDATDFIKTRACDTLESLHLEVKSHVESVQDKIHRVSRKTNRLAAVFHPNGGEWTVEPRLAGPKTFGSDARLDFTSSIVFSGRSTGIFAHHYGAVADQALIEARGYSEPPLSEEDLGLDHHDVQRSYHDTRRTFKMQFMPLPGIVYHLHAQTFGCFEQGNRDMHLHLWPDTYYEETVDELDLRAFLPGRHNRYVLSALPTDAPTFHLVRWERGQKHRKSCDVCRQARSTGQLIQADLIEPGLWRWETREIRYGGAVWIEWNQTIKPI